MINKWILRILLIAFIAAGVVVVQPVETANACLPCTCPYENPPVNCYGPYSLFITNRRLSGDFDIQMMTHHIDGQTVSGIDRVYLSAARLNRLPDLPEEPLLVAKDGLIEFYKMPWGDYQINVGPTEEGVVYVLHLDSDTGAKLEETGFRVPEQ